MRIIINEGSDREAAAAVATALHGRHVVATQVAGPNDCGGDVVVAGYLSPTTAGFDLHTTCRRSLDPVYGDVAMFFWADVPTLGPVLTIDVTGCEVE